MINKICFMLMVVMVAVVCQVSGEESSSLKIQIEPSQILVNATYNGTVVTVTGEIPRDSDAVILLRGEGEEVSTKVKGKALGLLWMNMGKIVFHDIPSVYLIYSAKRIDSLSKTAEGDQNDLGFGFKSLKNTVRIVSESQEPIDETELFEEFLKLKKDEGLYAAYDDAVDYQDVGESLKSFSTKIKVSPRLKKGDYSVSLFVVKDGAVVAQTSRELNVAEEGFPAFVSLMAYEHSLLYGVLSVIIAIAAGLLMGVMFGGGKKKAKS